MNTAKNTIRLRYFVGPCAVKEIADRVKAAGFEVLAGTEHIIVTVETPETSHWDASATFLESLKAKIGTCFGLRAWDAK
jgi:hypothetical protein